MSEPIVGPITGPITGPIAGPIRESALPARRVGLVLGAGGLLGATWMIARLHQLEQAIGLDLRESTVVIGSSAGSVLAAAMASGVSVSELLDHLRGAPDEASPLARSGFDYETSIGAALPERPPLRIGSSTLLRHVARHPRRLGMMTALAAAAPPGRGSLGNLRQAIASVRAELASDGRADGGWPAPLRIVAIDYHSGERVAFGEPGAPETDVADAVVASCSIPGWFAPAVLAGRPYIDSGIRQATSADLLAGHDLTEIYVLAPLAEAADEARPTTRAGRVERRFRRHLTRVMEKEIDTLRATGLDPVVITPGAAERALMGANLMNSSRRLAVLGAALSTGLSSGLSKGLPSQLSTGLGEVR